jgi:hypothetical protein
VWARHHRPARRRPRSARFAGSRPSSCSTCATRTRRGADRHPRHRSPLGRRRGAGLTDAIAASSSCSSQGRRDRPSTRRRRSAMKGLRGAGDRPPRPSRRGSRRKRWRVRFESFAGASAPRARRRRSPRRWSSSRRAASRRRRSGWRPPGPYADAITRVLEALADKRTSSSLDHTAAGRAFADPHGRGAASSRATAGWPGGYNANAIARRRAAHRAPARRGQAGGRVRHRPQGRDVLPVPQPGESRAAGRASRSSPRFDNAPRGGPGADPAVRAGLGRRAASTSCTSCRPTSAR